jgi:hypothetical protein
MIVELVQDGSFLASGEGYDKPILAEGGSRKEAIFNFTVVYGDQYSAAQVADHLSMYGILENDK